jgi:hypothetical protein
LLGRPGYPDNGVMRVGPVPSVVALLVAAATAAGFSTLDLRRSDRELPGVVVIQTSPPPLAPSPAPAAGPAEAEPGWSGLGDVVLALVLLVGLVAAVWAGWLLLRRVRRPGGGSWYRLRTLRPAPAAARSPDGESLLAAIDEAVARSEDDPDPRRAVIACWVRLTEAASHAGIPRTGSDTATDLVIRLLRGSRVSEPVLAAFVEAYWLARYATHTVDEQMRTQARSALRRLRAELSAGVGTR